MSHLCSFKTPLLHLKLLFFYMFEFKDVPGRRVVKNVVVLLSKGLPDGLIIRVQRHPVKKSTSSEKSFEYNGKLVS